jgi:hypothetical protein
MTKAIDYYSKFDKWDKKCKNILMINSGVMVLSKNHSNLFDSTNYILKSVGFIDQAYISYQICRQNINIYDITDTYNYCGSQIDKCMLNKNTEQAMYDRISMFHVTSIVQDRRKMILEKIVKRFEKKIAVVSAYFKIDINKLDECKPIEKIPGFDYIMYVDKEYEEITKLKNIWDIRTIELPYNKGVYYTKHVKWLTHLLCPEYDYIIWVDCFYSPTNNTVIKKYINMMQENNIPIAMRTQNIKSVSDDIKWCILHKRITNDMKDIICNKLKENDFIPDNPCQTFWSSAVIKDNKDIRIHKMANELMELILNSGYRDQHWLPYLISKYKIPYKIINNQDNIIKTSGVYFSKNYLD